MSNGFFRWDLRQSNPVQRTEAHAGEVNCLSFNPITEYHIVTGSADKVQLKALSVRDSVATQLRLSAASVVVLLV